MAVCANFSLHCLRPNCLAGLDGALANERLGLCHYLFICMLMLLIKVALMFHFTDFHFASAFFDLLPGQQRHVHQKHEDHA